MSAGAKAAAGGRLAEHFESLEKQAHAARLGMWIFLATEALLFAGLFVSYANYRLQFPAEFAKASRHLETWIGTANTFVLLTSSLFVALATHFARRARPKATTAMLLAGLGLGVAFLGLKALEYSLDFREGLLPGRYLANPELLAAGAAGTGVFMSLYWLMTGLHALHVTVGMSVLAYVALLAWRGTFSADYDTPIELGGMYWHLVDLIWIFLWPLLYLAA